MKRDGARTSSHGEERGKNRKENRGYYSSSVLSRARSRFLKVDRVSGGILLFVFLNLLVAITRIVTGSRLCSLRSIARARWSLVAREPFFTPNFTPRRYPNARPSSHSYPFIATILLLYLLFEYKTERKSIFHVNSPTFVREYRVNVLERRIIKRTAALMIASSCKMVIRVEKGRWLWH